MAFVAFLPCVGGGKKLGIVHGGERAGAGGQLPDDGVVFLQSGGGVVDLQTEAAHKGELFLPVFGAIGAAVLHKIPAVGGGIDQHILRRGLGTAFHDGLQVLVFHLGLLEGEIIQKEDR